MGTSLLYEQVIKNDYLGETKVIRGRDLVDLKARVETQLSKWAEKEAKLRESQRQQEVREQEKHRKLKAQEQAQKERAEAERRAEAATRGAQEAIAALEGVLLNALDVNHALDWEALKDASEFPSFAFSEPEPVRPKKPALPTLEVYSAKAPFAYAEPEPESPPEPQPIPLADYCAAMQVPKRSVLEGLLPQLRRRREDLERTAREAWTRDRAACKRDYEEAMLAHRKSKRQWEARYAAARDQAIREGWQHAVAEMQHRYEHDVAQREAWEAAREVARAEYEANRTRFEQERAAQHGAIDQMRQSCHDGDPEAVLFCATHVIAASPLPCNLQRDFEVQFDPASETVVVSHVLPSIDDLPSALEYRYVVSRKEVVCKEMKDRERAALFASVVDQLALRTVHEVLQGCAESSAIQSVVFNGWADGIDPKTGNAFHSCIISCQVSREQYEALNLRQVDPHECLRSLAALSAGPLHELAPVRPILELDRSDSRFIEGREVLDAMENEGQNLAAMEWEDFEHLVRELFARVFAADGCEVNVTQASRDQGVDAIAFDPDPVRGGKFVIQAKRYNNVVGVEAVRDLYGTLINEGAVKGILVTTAYYGREAREFAKDKPLTLIDGPNLVHMLREHGYENVFIETKKKQGT